MIDHMATWSTPRIIITGILALAAWVLLTDFAIQPALTSLGAFRMAVTFALGYIGGFTITMCCGQAWEEKAWRKSMAELYPDWSSK